MDVMVSCYETGARSYEVATHGSDLSPMWSNMVEGLTVGRAKAHIITETLISLLH